MTFPLSLSKDKIKIVLLEGIHPRAEEVLHGFNYTNLRSYPTPLTENELIGLIKDAHMVGYHNIGPGLRYIFLAFNIFPAKQC